MTSKVSRVLVEDILFFVFLVESFVFWLILLYPVKSDIYYLISWTVFFCFFFFFSLSLSLSLLAAGVFPRKMFAVPSNCPQPDLTKPSLPLGLSDNFDKNHVATFWMPPLKKYYTYVPGHITIVNRAAATSSALVTVQPGDGKKFLIYFAR